MEYRQYINKHGVKTDLWVCRMGQVIFKCGPREKKRKPFVDNKMGYLMVRQNKNEIYPIHRMVYSCWSRIPFNTKNVVYHIDGDKMNNCIDNLDVMGHGVPEGVLEIKLKYNNWTV